jgi:hypothetical protein
MTTISAVSRRSALIAETTSAVVSNSGTDYVARPDSAGRCVPEADVRVVDPASGEGVRSFLEKREPRYAGR